jgi:hypothetical protein
MLRQMVPGELMARSYAAHWLAPRRRGKRERAETETETREREKREKRERERRERESGGEIPG